jgi:ribosomal protein S18 acetylase RimI-like enzyme
LPAGPIHRQCSDEVLRADVIMGISSSISRLTDYYKRHGFVPTMRRANLAVRRAFFSSRMVVFYCDLAKQSTAVVNIPSSLRVERFQSYAELSQRDLQEMINIWNPMQAHQNIQERFRRGASLWLIRSGDQLAGYGWTLRAGTIEPHYFPLTQDDVHLFDFHVFREFRGQGINPLLVTHILGSLAGECTGRAFIEAAEWNKAQLFSLRKTPFRQIGWAKKSTIFHRMILRLAPGETIGDHLKDAVREH